jgi:hypothetical protein
VKKDSRRFEPSKGISYLVPIILGILLLMLIIALSLVSLALLGLFPGV